MAVGKGASRPATSTLTVGRSLVLSLLIAVPSVALGQDPPSPKPVPEEEPLPSAEAQTEDVTETIVVTGSRIPRPNLTAVSPVTVVGQVEVQLQGGILAEEVLNQLPQVAPSQGSYISNGASGTATVDLRNLGAERTLVLINGRRL